ncbi:MAG: hypothetical protein KDI24_04870 [Pseudomonadales bacterium]|nr:hypothetical protein [Pseudomonadales bacterium]
MKLTGLSLQQAPPISSPFRFFLSAPLFGIASAIIMLWTGENIFNSRWTPETLALTHCMLLGFVTTTMLGAQMQMLPVLAGATINRPKQTGWITYTLWTLGVTLLIAAFLFGLPLLFQAAALILATATVFFAAATGLALLRSTSKIPSILGMKLALTALLITVTWGVILALGHTGYTPLKRPFGTDIHATWGILGWITLLMIVVAYQVVPLFQITNTYPKPVTRWLAPVFFTLIILRMGVYLWHQELTANHPLFASNALLVIDLLISSALTIFASVTLYLQHHRRRNIGESHQRFWRIACIGLLATLACWWTSSLARDPLVAEQVRFFCAILYTTTFVTPVIVGMLYKITAFLLWFHLQAINTQRTIAGETAISVPHMKGFIPEQKTKTQLYLLVTAQLFTLSIPASPEILTTAAGAAWLAHFSVMAFNLFSASLKYRRLSNSDSRQDTQSE